MRNMWPDKKDKKIIETIDRNARLTIAEISRKTGIQRDSVLYRLRRLEKEKVVRFYHAVLDPVALGFPVYVFVNVLQNLDEKNERLFFAHLREHPHVVYVAKTTGRWDVTMCIAARDLKHFDEILTGIRRNFSTIIKEYESASIIEELKYDKMAGLL